MKVRNLLVAAAAVCALMGNASAHAATLLDVTSVTITNSFNTWLQIGEVVATAPGGADVALSATASANVGDWPGSGGPGAVNDNDFSTVFPDIYHAGQEANAALTLTWAAPVSLDSLTIFGRTDCCQSRDSYNVSFFNGTTELYSTTLDATSSPNGAATSSSFPAAAAAPEPASWGLMILGLGAMGAVLRTQRRRGFAVASA